MLFVMQSYLIEVRGLKHDSLHSSRMPEGVVPYRGAWIETNCAGFNKKALCVVPYRGAWIETSGPVICHEFVSRTL